jgi:lysophospholipase L1-like esterase
MPSYRRRFESRAWCLTGNVVTPSIAEGKGVTLLPGVAAQLQPTDRRSDGVHPTARGYRPIADAVTGVLS